MKATRIISLVLAIVALCAVLTSCGNVIVVKDVSFAAITEDPNGKQTLLVDVLVGDIEGSASTPPTVLDGVIALLEENGVAHKADEKSITSIASKSEASRNGYFYVWEYTINKQEPEGRASDITLNEGDHIVYYLKPTKDQGTSGGSDTTEDTTAAE